MKKVSEARLTLTVRRPDGSIETTERPDILAKYPRYTEALHKAMVAGYKKSGKGLLIGYNFTEAVFQAEEADHFTCCARCGETVDTRTAVNQKEHGVVNHYCAACANVLRAVGMGEYSAMEARRTDKIDNTPAHK